MSLIPGPCGDLVLPDDCTDGLYLLADCFVCAGMEAIRPYLPQPDGSCDPFVGFVAFSQNTQPDDICNQLTVLVSKLSPKFRKLPGCNIGSVSVLMRLEAIFAVYPMVEEIESGQFHLPDPEVQATANRWLYSVGISLFNAIHDLVSTPDSCDGMSVATSYAMGDFLPSGPRGGCAGWNTTITAELR